MAGIVTDTCVHGLTRAFCARCKATTGRVAVLRADVSVDPYEGRRVDPYKMRAPIAARVQDVHSLVPVDAPDGVRGIIARMRLDLTYAKTITRKNGTTYAKPITKGRLYRMRDIAGRVDIVCPMCAKRGVMTRMGLDEAILVTPYIVPLPRIESCLECEGDAIRKVWCLKCDGRGWVVLGQDLVQCDLACMACVSELRGGNNAVYTAPNHSGEPGNPRRGGGMGTRSADMCRGCQMQPANKRTGLCTRCQMAPQHEAARNLRRVNHRIAEITQEPFGKDA